MSLIFLHDKATIERYLLKFPQLNYYHLGDLDDFFWPYTTWYGWQDAGQLKALVLFYTGIAPAVLLAILNENQPEMKALLRASLPFLPPKFYSHLSPGLESIFQENYTLEHHGEHFKMGLTGRAKLDAIDTAAVEPLASEHLPEITALYQAAYPGNWFDPRMLETGQYVGLRDAAGQLVSAAGIHVYSPVYKIAALGNITTHPDRRGEGLGTTVTAGLCKRLLETVETIGLNVRSDNAPAIAAYRKIGFEVVGTYHEWMVTLKLSAIS